MMNGASVQVYLVTDFGAVAGATAKATKAVQKAVDEAHARGGGTVVVPAGVFTVGTIVLRSRVRLHLEPGAVLRASMDRADYSAMPLPGSYVSGQATFLIRALNESGIALTGEGVIDGRGVEFMEGFRSPEGPYIRKPRGWRPPMCGLFGCRNVTLRDLTFRDASNWCLHLTGCDDVVISGLRILNDLALPNCDGIDPDHCTNVRISDCHIEAGDDCIVVKTSAMGRALGYSGSHNITVSNCTLMSTSAALKLGTEGVSDMTDLLFQNCVIRSSGRGIALQLRDGGNMENVMFSHCTVETRLFHRAWWGQAEPIYVTAVPRDEGCALGRIRHVRFSHMLCRGENGVFVAGSPGSPVEDLALEDVSVTVDKWSRWPGGMHDRRPAGGTSQCGLTPGPTHGVYLQHARDVRLRDVRVRWGADRQPYWGRALFTEDVEGLEVRGLDGE
jgi:hypothetical protein